MIYIHDDTVKSEKRLKTIFSIDNTKIVNIILKLKKLFDNTEKTFFTRLTS